ncbi:MAG: hypothetical protein ACTS73_06410 [Arsenophonus sp. NEOnobi-MAG3]
MVCKKEAARGLTVSLRLAMGYSALAFWNAMAKIFMDTSTIRCLVYKIANMLTSLYNGRKPKIKLMSCAARYWATREDSHNIANKTLDILLARFSAKCILRQ